MKARGGTARSGDVIPYVFCLGDNGESSKSAQADHAKHPDEVRKADSGLKIGVYIASAIYIPLSAIALTNQKKNLQTTSITSLSKFFRLSNVCVSR